MSLFGLRWYRCGACARVWEGGISVYVVGVLILCVDGRPRYLYIVLGILGALSVQSCCTLSISASYRVFICVRYHKSRRFVWLSDLDLSRHRPQL